MTNKEAIEELKKVDTLDMPARLCKAHYMAIEALKRLDKIAESCERYGKEWDKYVGYIKVYVAEDIVKGSDTE